VKLWARVWCLVFFDSQCTTLWIWNVNKCDTVFVTGRDSHRLLSFHMSCQWQILWVKWYDHVKNSDTAASTSLPNVNDIIAKRRLALFGHVVRLDATHQLTRYWNRPWMSSPGTDLLPNGGDLLDDHATPGYSRLTTAHWQASDSPGELLKIVGITDHRFGPPLPMSDGDVTRSSATADGHTMFSNSCQQLHNCRNCRNKLRF